MCTGGRIGDIAPDGHGEDRNCPHPGAGTLGPFGADKFAVYRRFEPPEPRRELALAWRRSFPRGDALQELARGLPGALA
jgi:hypothetical protein